MEGQLVYKLYKCLYMGQIILQVHKPKAWCSGNNDQSIKDIWILFSMYGPNFASRWAARLAHGASLVICERELGENKKAGSVQKGQKRVLMEQHLSQELSFLLVLFKTTAVKQGISSYVILIWEIFLWISTILLRMSARYKQVICSNKMLRTG